VPNYREDSFVIRNFQFQDGGRLPELRIRYYTFGTPRQDTAGNVINAVLLLHGTTGTGRHYFDANWIDNLYRPGQPLDATKFFLIAPDGIGHGGSSKPSDGLRAKFPRYGYNDVVTAQHRLITEHLDIKRLRLLLGTSMGGMHGYLWGERYPEAMDGIVTVAAEPVEMAGRNYLWRRMLVEAIKQDPDWKNGEYDEQPRVFASMVPLFDIMVGTPVYLKDAGSDRVKAAAFYDRLVATAQASLDANDYLYGWDSCWDYDPGPALGKIKAPLLAIGFADDLVNAPELKVLETEVKKIPNGRFAMIKVDAAKSLGHQNRTQPQLWREPLAQFLIALPRQPG